MHILLKYKPSFLHELKKIKGRLQEDVLEATERFKDTDNHQILRVHKLHGRLKSCFGFSVNYRYRIIFQWTDTKKNTAELLDIGDHNIYE